MSEQVLPIKKTDSIAAMMPVHQFEEADYLLMATQEGLIKKTPLSQFSDVRSNGLAAMKLKVLPSLAPPPSASAAASLGVYCLCIFIASELSMHEP